MTVEEIIKVLQEVEDKSKLVIFDVSMKTYTGSIMDDESAVYITNLMPMPLGLGDKS